MSQATASDTPAFPAADSAPPSPRPALDAAVAALGAGKGRWAALPVVDRVSLLARLSESFAGVAERWVEAGLAAEGLDAGSGPASGRGSALGGEEWLAGPYFVLRNLRLLRQSLGEVAASGAPRIPGPLGARSDGRAVAGVFPASSYDRLFFPKVTAEVWMQPGVSREELAESQAVAYRRPGGPGAVCLVLGAGNVSSIGPMDALYELFVENQVVLYKMHPVNAYLGPLLEEGFTELVERGFLRVVYGGAEEGAYLCRHDGVDEIHVTGSDKTYEAIVFGPGEEGRRRKAEGLPLLAKRVTAELGNVSPVIVVPGRWSASDLAYQAENLVSMLANNAGFNCNATRVIITHAEWPQRQELLAAMRRCLAALPTRRAYYPGAGARLDAFLAAHPEAESYGRPAGGELPWVLVPGLDPAAGDDVCYRTEAFCGLFGETPIAAPEVDEYVDRAVAFANQTLWGTLCATLIVHPRSLADVAVAAAVERAVADLAYGTVSINHWAAVGYGLVTTTWGAYPGHTPRDIQSGVGVVHNTLMFSRAEKSVVRAPFRASPKPPWFVTHRTTYELARRLARFEAAPSPARLPGIFWAALRG